MATVVKAMAQPDSGLEIRDRMWLKITIPNAFIGKEITWTELTLVSKICNFHDSASLVVDCKSLTLGWISLSLYKVVVDSINLW